MGCLNNVHLIPDHLKWTADESVPLQLGLEELLGHGLPDVEAVGAAPGAGEKLISIILSYHQHIGLSYLIIITWGRRGAPRPCLCRRRTPGARSHSRAGAARGESARTLHTPGTRSSETETEESVTLVMCDH